MWFKFPFLNAAIVGDITPHDGVSDAEKHSLESAAIQKMRGMLGTSVIAGKTGGALLPRVHMWLLLRP